MASERWNNYQNKYSKEHYKSLGAMLDSTLVNKFKKKLKADGKTVAGFLKEVIEKYLGSSI